jgi:hypothetical protein
MDNSIDEGLASHTHSALGLGGSTCGGMADLSYDSAASATSTDAAGLSELDVSDVSLDVDMLAGAGAITNLSMADPRFYRQGHSVVPTHAHEGAGEADEEEDNDLSGDSYDSDSDDDSSNLSAINRTPSPTSSSLTCDGQNSPLSPMDQHGDDYYEDQT